MNKYKSLISVYRDSQKGLIETSSRASLVNSIKRVILGEQPHYIEKHVKDQIVAGTYHTKNFEQAPKAQILYTKLPKDTPPDVAEKAAIFQDQLFAIEKQVLATSRATPEDVESARVLVDKIMHMASMMNLKDEHSYVNDSFAKIQKYASQDSNVVDQNKLDLNKEVERRFGVPPYEETPERRDMDIDNSKFLLSRNLKAQRKLKIIDND